MSFTDINGATFAIYTLRVAGVGKYLRVEARYDDPHGTSKFISGLFEHQW